MTTYKVNFSYAVPEWASVEVNANDMAEAANFARDQMDFMYPEALDVEVTSVEAINV